MWSVLRADARSIPGCPCCFSHLLLPQPSEEAAAPTAGTVLDLVVKDSSGSRRGCPRRGPHLLPWLCSLPPGPCRRGRGAGSVTAGAAPGAAAAASDTRRCQQCHRSPGRSPARWETRGQPFCCQARLSPLGEGTMPVAKRSHQERGKGLV